MWGIGGPDNFGLWFAVTEDPIHPFPATLSAETSDVLARLASANEAVSPNGFSVNVRGERLLIPSRIYAGEQTFFGCGGRQRPYVDCLLTRHHDGFVRAKALGRVIALNEDWSIPFVVQLVGEYVVEILDQVEGSFGLIDLAVVGGFVRDNPAFLQLTRQRVVSYWDCYYRRRFRREDYVGFRLIERFQEAGERLDGD
jgi:hypothetical protein